MNLRHEYLSLLAREIQEEIVVTNTGITQHEWSHLADRDANLYAPGMGLVCQVALGLAIALPNRRVIALDGDGSLLLNLGILPVLGHENPANLTIIVFDNGCYESIGTNPTLSSFGTDLEMMARGAGIKNSKTIARLDDFLPSLNTASRDLGLYFFVIKVTPGGLSVPPKRMSGMENKFRFVHYIEAQEGKTILSPPTQSPQSGK
ncbi:MAG: thiamine pyrophosphate-binding protein [Deltaproteobacteria bacterium]|nr:thiamine pyrophosphate-binding protein [Deltaproteobacteria bacterium]